MKKTVKDIDVKGKKCLVRVDFNVPVADGKVTDDNRILGALPTIRYLTEHGAKVILCSHLGRPKGQVQKKYSLQPVAEKLAEVLHQPVVLTETTVGADAEQAVNAMKDGDVVLLENVRFCPEEEKNDPAFAKKLAAFADVYVNDAFGTAHRAHASTAGVAQFVNDCVSGFLMEKELNVLGGLLEQPQRPFTAILGGAKVSDKIGVISNLLQKADRILIGGGMAYTFFRALGYSVGTSICEEDKKDLAMELMQTAKDKGVELLLPVDNVVSAEFNETSEVRVVKSCEIPDGFMGMGIGPETAKLYCEKIRQSKTILWNGPLGVFEMEKFREGTYRIAEAVADSGAVSVVGGGDSASAVIQMGFRNKITHISTGGGASLEFLEGRELPGVACLDEKE